MDRVIVDAKLFDDKVQMHAMLRERFELPDYYGNNLDALWDCLTERAQDCEIVLRNFEVADDVPGRPLLLLFLELSHRLSNYRLSLESDSFAPDAVYRHFKGGLYRARCLAFNSETLEIDAVYETLADGGVWVRPARMWGERVQTDSGEVVRFARVVPEEQ